MKFMMIHDTVEENGLTIKENNLNRKHQIPIGELVEVIPWDIEARAKWEGIRLRVVAHHRDCDGSPLYSIGVPGVHELLQHHGLSGDSLKRLSSLASAGTAELDGSTESSSEA